MSKLIKELKKLGFACYLSKDRKNNRLEARLQNRAVSILGGKYAYCSPRLGLPSIDQYELVEVALIEDGYIVYPDIQFSRQNGRIDVFGYVPIENVPELANLWASYTGTIYLKPLSTTHD